MKPRKVSIIIPAYNMANYLGETIQDILNQTYQDFEIIIVNDASTDHTDQVMQQFNDQRIKYIVHSENRYAAAARNTGIRVSEGEYIAFIDADDKVHPEKLAIQVAFLERNPEIGLSYCSRIEIDQNDNQLALVPAQSTVSLKDLVLGYPYAPSEVVMRQEWVHKVGLFDESFRFSAEDPDFHMRLALYGCKMAGVNRVLNYRRLHKGRDRKNLHLVVADQVRAFQNTFASPLCPIEIKTLREQSLGNLYRILSFVAFSQNDTDLGRELICKAVEFDKSYFLRGQNNYIEFLVRSSIRNSENHVTVLRSIIQQLPPEFGVSDEDADLGIGYGYLLRWAQDFLWGRLDSGLRNFEKARSYGSKMDERFLKSLTLNLLNYENEFGPAKARVVFDRFLSHLRKYNDSASARKLKYNYKINHALRAYHSGENAIPSVLRAVSSNPIHLLNSGVMSMLFHSSIDQIKELFFGKLPKKFRRG